MEEQLSNIQIVLILTIGFAYATLLGYFAHRLKLSPILGYLVAGFLIGPFSPGFVADLKTAEQLAEIGVILMMFQVGMELDWRDLVGVSKIAIPGAIGQTLIATLAGSFFIYLFGWPIDAGIVIGLSISVASTVVLIRALLDNHLLKTVEGNIAVGWLIVEDLITIVFLILIPSMGHTMGAGGSSVTTTIYTVFITLIKFIVLAAVLLAVGHRVVSYMLRKIILTESHELFTVAVFALTFIIATGSTYLIGISLALGAFIAGIVIGQTEMRERAILHSTPMKDAFMVIFFLSVGMLFNPTAIIDHFVIFIGVLSIILIIKPLAAFLICLLLKHPYKTGLTVALALAQIGEFSFIMAESGSNLDILSDEGYDIIVACAIFSIAINPLLFKLLKREKTPSQ